MPEIGYKLRGEEQSPQELIDYYTVEFEKAGYDHVWLHQAGPDQEGFFRFFEKEVFPKLDHE